MLVNGAFELGELSGWVSHRKLSQGFQTTRFRLRIYQSCVIWLASWQPVNSIGNLKPYRCRGSESSWDTNVRRFAVYGKTPLSLRTEKLRDWIQKNHWNDIWLISVERWKISTLQWRHDERDGVSNHQPHYCSLKRFRSKKTSKLRGTGLCEGNSPMTGEVPVQMASNAKNVSIWWRHNEPISSPFMCKVKWRKICLYFLSFLHIGSLCWELKLFQGLYLLSGPTSYRKISWSLEAARLGVILIVSQWKLKVN